MSRPAIVALAALGFLAGFAVADLTGVRALGGLVLVLAGWGCARAALPLVGRGPTIRLLAVAFVAFVVAHPLGLLLGAWPAVVLAAAAVAAAAAHVLRAPAPRPALR